MLFGDIKNLKMNEVWPHEARDFTPWISEKISEIGDLLGYEFVHIEKEAPVGNFSLDILARDLGDNSVVVIENQFGRTDHDHLGKLLTYAAGYSAKKIIIICEEFRDEHKKTLEWLNEVTIDEVGFYGLSVDLFQIDDSRPAYKFHIAIAPNGWQRTVISPRSTEVTEKGELYRSFFQRTLDELREKNFSNAKKAQPQNWYSFAIGVDVASLSLSFSRQRTARVELYIDNGEYETNKAVFDYLLGLKFQIEEELGTSLTWERLDLKQASRLAVEVDATIYDAEDVLERVRTWMIEWAFKFKPLFKKLIEEMRKGE